MSSMEVFGTNQYKLRSQPLGLYAFKERTPAWVVASKNTYLRVPSFSAAFSGWPGASYVVANAQLSASANWSIVTPVSYPDGFNACVAVRWTSGGGDVLRYKLWEDVGEVLAYPLYAGEVLPPTGVYLEFWCVNDGSSTMILPADWDIKTAGLTLPSTFNDTATDTTAGSASTVCVTESSPPSGVSDYFTRCV